MRDLEILRGKYNICGLFVEFLLINIAITESKAGYRDDQARGPDGRWIIGGGHYIVSERHTTGNRHIDGITEKIMDVLDQVLSTIGPGAGNSYGSFVHSSAANILREMNIPGIGEDGIEQSFQFGDVVRYGLSNSVRTDVILRHDQTGEILAVWDIKTGSASLNPKRVAQIRQNLDISDDIPVIEVHINLGVKVKDLAESFQRGYIKIHFG